MAYQPLYIYVARHFPQMSVTVLFLSAVRLVGRDYVVACASDFDWIHDKFLPYIASITLLRGDGVFERSFVEVLTRPRLIGSSPGQFRDLTSRLSCLCFKFLPQWTEYSLDDGHVRSYSVGPDPLFLCIALFLRRRTIRDILYRY